MSGVSQVLIASVANLAVILGATAGATVAAAGVIGVYMLVVQKGAAAAVVAVGPMTAYDI